jgi:multiple antibiotic resistance protein
LVETFLLVFAAIFPVVNPPGSALVFLSLTRHASTETRLSLAWRVALNCFFVMVGSLSLGALVLSLYGISVPIIRVAGGIVVAVSGWKLLNEGSQKDAENTPEVEGADLRNIAFYPLTLPLTTGPGTIAVMISLGFGLARQPTKVDELIYVAAILLAVLVIAAMIYICFANAGKVENLLGRMGTDIAVRLSAFILFCIGIQILWIGISELLSTATLPILPATHTTIR